MSRKNIVIGSGLPAVLFAYLNDYTLLSPSHRGPFRFDELPEDVDVERVNIPTRNKRVIWSTLLFELAMKGLSPYGKDINSVRISENNISVTIRESSVIKNKFDNCFIFDPEIVQVQADVIDQHPIRQARYRVLDWMNVRSGMVHPFDRIEGTTPFVNCIHFYPSERIDGEHDKKDLVSVSYLTREQMNSYEFSDTYARFSVIDKMKKAGIRGARNGRDMKNPNKYKYYSVKAETARRLVRPLHSEISYTPSKGTSNGYLQYLMSNL